MGIKGLEHLYMETRSFEESRSFWEGLGFELKQQWSEGGHKAGILSCGSASIVLAEVDEAKKPVLDIHFDLSAPESFMEKILKEKRIEITKPLHDSHWNSRLIQVKDPDGRTFWLESAN